MSILSFKDYSRKFQESAQRMNERRLYNASDDMVTVDCDLCGELDGNPIKYLKALQKKYGYNLIGMEDEVVLCPVGPKTQVWIHKGAEYDSPEDSAAAAMNAKDTSIVRDPNYKNAMSIINTFTADDEKGEQWYEYLSAYYEALENLA